MTITEREVTRGEWSDTVDRSGLRVDRESFLHSDEDGWAEPVGQDVVVFLPGWVSQRDELGLPADTLQWTGFRQRNLRECGLRHLTRNRVETRAECLVTGCSYLVRENKTLVERTAREGAAGQPADAAEGEEADAAVADRSGSVEEAMALLGNNGETAAAGDAVVEDDPEEPTTTTTETPFLRLQLQRRSSQGVGTVIYLDYYLNSDAVEFVVRRDRYQRGLRSRFKIDDRVTMFFQDPEDPEQGQWFEGTVLSTHRKASSYAEHLLKNSDWETIKVYWEETKEVSLVNLWEVNHVKPRLGEDGRALDAGPNQEPKEEFNPQEYNDRDFLPSTSTRRGRGRPRGSTSKPAREEARLPQTMINKTSKSMNWSDNLCSVCQLPNNLIRCSGQCLRSFHRQCIPGGQGPGTSAQGSKWFCSDCREGKAFCEICKKIGKAGVDVHKCKMGGCGSFYHLDCLRKLPAWSVGWGQKNGRDPGAGERHMKQIEREGGKPVFVCPGHFCHECHLSGDALRMLRCSSCKMLAYHSSHARWDHCLKVASDKNLLCAHCTYHAFHPQGCEAMPDLLTFTPAYGPGCVIGRVKKVSKGTVLSELALVGKKRFLFGSHNKGRGCDFILNLKGIEFHSEIIAESHGKYYIRSSNIAKKCKTPLLVNHDAIDGGAKVYLKDGDVFQIGNSKFVFEIIKDAEALGPQEDPRFPYELAKQRPKAAPSHAEDQAHMNKLLGDFDISGYNLAFSKLKKSQQQRQEKTAKATSHRQVKAEQTAVSSRGKRKRESKPNSKYANMAWESEDSEEPASIVEEEESDSDSKLRAFASNPILPPPMSDTDSEEEGREDDFMGTTVNIFENGASETAERHTQTPSEWAAAPSAPNGQGGEAGAQQNGNGSHVMSREESNVLSPREYDLFSELLGDGNMMKMVEKAKLWLVEEERQKVMDRTNHEPKMDKLQEFVSTLCAASEHEAEAMVRNLTRTEPWTGFTKDTVIKALLGKLRKYNLK